MKRVSFLLALFLLVAVVPTSVNAGGKVCRLDGKGFGSEDSCVTSPACGDSTTRITISNASALRINPNVDADTPIYVYGTCRYLDNSDSRGHFVPFKTSEEWNAFLDNIPDNLSTTICTLPDSSFNFGPSQWRTGDLGGPNTFSVDLPYWRTGKFWSRGGCKKSHTFKHHCLYKFYDTSLSRCNSTWLKWEENFDFTAETPNGRWIGKSIRLPTSQNRPANCNKRCIIPPVNGACGSANNQSFKTKPRSNLCRGGTASHVRGSGPWGWSCNGSNGGRRASCFAKKELLPVNGKCGSANKKTADSKPRSRLCAVGSSSTVTGSGPWNWSCKGTNSGGTAWCSAPKTILAVNGMCGSASNKVYKSTPSISSLCRKGKPSSLSGNGTLRWKWICLGNSGGINKNCTTAPQIKINGACGPAAGKTYSSKPPRSARCRTGLSGDSAVRGAHWLWSCYGNYGGSHAGCNARYKKPCTPTVCKSCNSSGNLVNKRDGITCRASNTGWCLSGRCQAYFFDVCSGRKGYIACWKSPSKANSRGGSYLKRSCRSCPKGKKTGGDSCTKCPNTWGSGRSGEWGHTKYF